MTIRALRRKCRSLKTVCTPAKELGGNIRLTQFGLLPVIDPASESVNSTSMGSASRELKVFGNKVYELNMYSISPR